MSLVSEVVELAQALGTEIKALRAGAGSPDYRPSDHGLKAWSYDPINATANALPTGGVLQVVRIPLRRAETISTVNLMVATAGASLTNVGVALYTDAGVLIEARRGSNGATPTAFQSIGLKPVTFTPVVLSAPFYVAWWTTGTTQPAFSKISGATVTVNALHAAPTLRYGIANTGLTTTAPATLGAQTQSGNPWWVGVS